MLLPWILAALGGFIGYWLTTVWRGLSDEQKKQIIEILLKIFEVLLREFYRRWRGGGF